MAITPSDDPDLDATAAFVRVAVEFRTANYALTPIVGALSGTIDAKAVAGMGSALCRSPPVMICNPDEPVGNTDPNYDFDADSYEGDGLLVSLGGGGSWTPGNFGYLDTGIANGAPGVRAALGWVSPPGNCVSQNGDDVLVDTEPGNMTSVTQALNTRFDIYDNQGCETGGTCPASINSRKDCHAARPTPTGQQACKSAQSRLAGSSMRAISADIRHRCAAMATIPTSMGHPTRHVPCRQATVAAACTGAFGDGLWDRDAYFRSHYLRTSAGAGGAIGTRWTAAQWWTNTGLASDASCPDVSRYEVYSLGNRTSRPDHRRRGHTRPGPPGPQVNIGETRHPRVQRDSERFWHRHCADRYRGDRRRISVAVDQLQGRECQRQCDGCAGAAVDGCIPRPAVC